MKILVTGANGMLGKDLCPILDDMGYFVMQTDIDNLDITNPNATSEMIKTLHPDLVIHCAAYTNVDKAEEDVDNAFKVNAEGTENVAKACAEIDIPIIYISTDYVFDGKKKSPYEPSDLPNPINVYGRSKLKGEMAVIENCKKYYIARTSWLYGINGKNFIETMLSLKDKPELKVINDQNGSPTWSVDLASNLIKLLSFPYGIYHLTGSGRTTWYDFACKIFKLEGVRVNINPTTSEEYKTKAKRPLYSVLKSNGVTLDHWENSLKNYLELRRNK